MLLLLDILLVF